ncbi:MAG: hypothetical protein JSR96_06955 [Proteobacteria bacterium]|nr:hypothetical protein [Pseudomonadota bacterium]
MTCRAEQLGAAAQHLVGCRFRLHGRDPATGLDCIGLLAASLKACGIPADLPAGYPLRLTAIDPWLPDPETLDFAAVQPPFLPGDVVLLIPGPAQFHLAIAATDGGWIHAHAGLRRVVHSPCLPGGPVIGHWRLR